MAKSLLNEKLIRRMVEKGLIRAEDAELVLSKGGSRSEVSLFNALVEKDLLSEDEIFNFLKDEFGYPAADPTHFTITPEVLKLIPQEVALEHKVLPLFLIDNVLTIATSDPTSIIALDDIRAKLKLKFDVMLCLPNKLDEAIEKNYTQFSVAEVPQGQIEELMNIVQRDDSDVSDEDAAALRQQASETPVIKVANLLIAEAIRKNASDLFVEPWEKSVRIRIRVDGVLEELKAPPKSMANALISRIKVMSQLNIAERRIPQDGRFKVKIQNREVDVRVSVVPSSFGEKICLRILDKKGTVLHLNKLGFLEEELEKIRQCASKPHGMILVTGPTGSGKSTTLYSILNLLHSPEKNITTVEDPVEYQIAGINQVNVHENIGLTFAAALRSILRQDPDIVMIGEIRDFDTLDIAIKAALTGHLVLSTLHTNDAISSLIRIRNMGLEPFLISSSILMISAQRLARRLCQQCREPYTPDHETIERYHLTEKSAGGPIQLYHPVGCQHCGRKGYQGRTLLTEVFLLTPKIRSLIMTQVSQDELKRAAKEEGMRTLRDTGIIKSLQGETSLEEVIRLTAGEIEISKNAT
ncbi:MAG: Flp pilus assembly complex ATPase component TadA [Candidatus Omnitrophica bacterium]|nr:Flp pilus assembly complex ATPase component TadA [Candidatus Omnitrophota bacterium]